MDGETLADLARLLRQLRRRDARRRGGSELTYRRLAAKTGWSAGIIAHYFTGKTLPPTDRFDTLVRLLGVTPAEHGRLATVRDRVEERRREAAKREPTGQAEIRVLGPIEVTGPKGTAALAGPRQRTLIALLALQPGTAIPQDRLIDAMWGQRAPRTAARTLHAHIARVRHALDACGLPGAVVTSGSGYLLDARPGSVDAARFEELATLGRRALADGAVNDAIAQLLGALALWRGPALQDAEATGWGAAEARRLDESRLRALEDLWDARLRLGEHSGAVGEIERLLTAHPARERLVELLMLALYRSGRFTQAAELYQRLGVEPSPHLRRLQASVASRDPSLDLERRTLNVPAQLPPRPGHFTGRATERSTLDSAEGIVVISGAGGMGKTALAVHWAHDNLDRFPDGQLFLDLRGHDPAAALPPGEVLAHLLRGLGLTGDIGLYRSTLRERRVLIVLDNAGSAEQVASLVPPSGGSLLIVTSRHQLAALAVEHEVTRVNVDVLTTGDASRLLERILGTQRMTSEVDRLIELCGGMPLALRIAAARLATRPLWTIAHLIAELAGGDRLSTLTLTGDPRSVRAVFAGAHRALSPPAAELFRLLGGLPGATFTTWLAAAMGGPEALEELASAHLVSEVDADRFRQHDLIRLYAAECASEQEQAVALQRALRWYLAVADATNRLLEPARDRVRPDIPLPPEATPPTGDVERMLGLLDAERANLLPLAQAATERGHAREAWQLTYLMVSYFTHRGHLPEQLAMCRQGLEAALLLGDPVAERLMRSGLGVACNTNGQYQEALEHLERALALMRAGGDKRGQAMALNNMALACWRLGRLDDSAARFEEALRLHTEDGHEPGIALALNNLGDMYSLLGRHDLAVTHLERGLALAQRIGNAPMEGLIQQTMGEAQLAIGDEDGALEHFHTALAIRRRIGERRREADTCNTIGLLLASRGDHAGAVLHLGRTLALARELGDRALEAATLAHLGSHVCDP
ncbi:BTAD domain-containing putative transcriptional regulator [Allorhizocola rhizosphaerae]|uniref:BTAD domain-containing putative transcriptional regulator n=1 Tax=Allorhizocola rhizosphaerae TaxID=1872709 RepID=UPI000E3DB436|nr:BTAD domain-containing putative transcriptional regulator [Allorhizocola rhizosphaerae]